MQPITNLSEGTGYAGAYQHIYLIIKVIRIQIYVIGNYDNLTYGDLVTKLGRQVRADLHELGTVASSSTAKISELISNYKSTALSFILTRPYKKVKTGPGEIYISSYLTSTGLQALQPS